MVYVKSKNDPNIRVIKITKIAWTACEIIHNCVHEYMIHEQWTYCNMLAYFIHYSVIHRIACKIKIHINNDRPKPCMGILK